ncbi:Clan S-, family S54, Rhomboid-like serine peptidase [Tritrichomonas foetus]|uniref:rhomboid protease n=1 Tax=Tritrichomonas foetus TaxID=1144522 RepID=A0A1J4KFU6_9EUKA|nr:Clan S-, family S54, Rhomboid-like serine peptidase [Tritrichomonas foetus]|eukprot:OHT10281.1 Clan S-, family S54, Rhomboid-like serine peptidase [Tritrichomonas foetus]
MSNSNFYGNRQRGNGMNYHDMMGSVGNLPADDQEKYNTRQYGLQQSRGFITPMNGGNSDVNWWNQYGTDDGPAQSRPKSTKSQVSRGSKGKPTKSGKGNKTQPTKPTKPTRVEESESSDSVKIEVPLVNLDAPSPYLWTIGIFIVITIILVGELYQMGFSNIEFKNNPMGGPNSEILLMMGAKYSPMILDGDWWRIFSAVFLQSGIIVWAVSAVLLFFTKSIERDTGFYRMMLTFMVCGVYGYILSCIFIPSAITCGSTGALIGLVGVMLCDLIASWKIVTRPIFRLVGVIIIIVILIVGGLTPYVDNFAHIGGLIMGLLTALMLVPNLNFGRCQAYCHGIISFFAFPIMSTLFMVCLVIVFRSVDTNLSWCKGCEKINCVNFVSNWCDYPQDT